MPLVMFSGFPCSGKSTRCEHLVNYIKKNHSEVPLTVISENDLSEKNKNEIFKSVQMEKESRGNLKSKVNQFLSKENLVMMDAMNYIKGYRYELNCISKYAQTTQCVIHIATPADTCKAWNSSRNDEDKYNEDVFDALVQRFETPDSRNRWDSPLFTVHPSDEFPYKQVCDSLFHGKKPTPNNSTQNPPLMSAEFLHEVDKKTQEITSAIISAQKSCIPGDTFLIPGTNINYEIKKKLTLSELRRHRLQFINFIKTNAAVQVENIPRTFVMFLTKSMG